ncbi:MAG: hypothetical protein Barrevirus22_6 [Barrevirus sp.]|uniref:Uncharacterized protein n=1 Tax=Barrevirus sp. TaxID=2487763 RepID=A0A3G4ZQR2_9VIRU|nr:MAG: hypothetical protein Barrevirus22_6 [Barrevirus sp.]
MNMNNLCEWFKTDLSPCNRPCNGVSVYCDGHFYVIGYTDEMKEKSRLCTACRRVCFIPEGYRICCAHLRMNKDHIREKKVQNSREV